MLGHEMGNAIQYLILIRYPTQQATSIPANQPINIYPVVPGSE